MRGQATLFGAVASATTAHRVLKSVHEGLLEWLRAARAEARAAAWRAGARPERLVLDVDATLVTAHSEKEEAAGIWKGGSGFHPLLCFLAGTNEGLAGLLRSGKAGSNTAADHERVLIEALERLPPEALDEEILVRADIGDATHDFTRTCRDANICFSVGYELTETLRGTLLKLPAAAWQAAIDAEGEEREGAWVAELTEDVELAPRPDGTRLIARRERPHPGAQLGFADADGHRFTCFLTDRQDEDLAALELRHRRRAWVEDRIRCAKDAGLENLSSTPSRNQVWLELVLSRRTCSPGHRRSSSTASWRSRNPSACAIACSTPRPARALGPPRQPAARPRLALGRVARGGVPPPESAPARRRTITAAPPPPRNEPVRPAMRQPLRAVRARRGLVVATSPSRRGGGAPHPELLHRTASDAAHPVAVISRRLTADRG